MLGACGMTQGKEGRVPAPRGPTYKNLRNESKNDVKKKKVLQWTRMSLAAARSGAVGGPRY